MLVLVVHVVGLPLILVGLLAKNKRRMHADSAFQAKWGVLYQVNARARNEKLQLPAHVSDSMR